ncbi:alpha-galactosidase [Streptomyces europaeiscabiei]|uniref:alpha-galactosidase n=1 Tax=Streptomyces europaeiscabiei TaxID=146819 RepID=UPI0038D4FB0D
MAVQPRSRLRRRRRRRLHRPIGTGHDAVIGSAPQAPLQPVGEAVYFDHDLDKLTHLADLGAQVGVERFVLDDGWFRHRRDDRAGLGDRDVDETAWPIRTMTPVTRTSAARRTAFLAPAPSRREISHPDATGLGAGWKRPPAPDWFTNLRSNQCPG